MMAVIVAPAACTPDTEAAASAPETRTYGEQERSYA